MCAKVRSRARQSPTDMAALRCRSQTARGNKKRGRRSGRPLFSVNSAQSPQQPCLRVGKLAVGGNFLRKLRLLSIAFSKILLIGQGVLDMECHFRIFFVHKYLRDILRFYTQRSDPCLIERITPIDIFRFTIKLDSRSRQRIRDASALVGIRSCCNL